MQESQNTPNVIQEDNGTLGSRLIRAFIGAVLSGIIGGIALAGIIIWQEGSFSVRNLMFMGLILGFFIGGGTYLPAREKSKYIGMIAIIGCVVAIIAGRYALLYWFSRDIATSVFDLSLMQDLFTTPALWGIQDLAWFLASAATAWYIASQNFVFNRKSDEPVVQE